MVHIIRVGTSIKSFVFHPVLSSPALSNTSATSFTWLRKFKFRIKTLVPQLYSLHFKCSIVPQAQLSSVTQLFPTLCDPMNHSTPGLPVHHQFLEFTQTHVHWVGDAINHLILCHPLFLLPSIFPSIRVFSTESAFHISWPKYWSFGFNISPST